MFTRANFPDYVSRRKNFYDELASFAMDSDHLSTPIAIDQSFMDRVKSNFESTIDQRIHGKKFTKEENKNFKNSMREIFPETIEVFSHSNPTIYWFEIDNRNSLTNKDIIEHYWKIRDKGKRSGWWTKADRSRASSTTNILYLGKIETALQNRFIQHIGLGHEYTSSLKLSRWVPDLNGLTLKFQFLKLDPKWKSYTEDIEKVLWEVTEPLLGAKPRI